MEEFEEEQKDWSLIYSSRFTPQEVKQKIMSIESIDNLAQCICVEDLMVINYTEDEWFYFLKGEQLRRYLWAKFRDDTELMEISKKCFMEICKEITEENGKKRNNRK